VAVVIDRLLDALFTFEKESRVPWFSRLCLAGLFLSGAGVWGYFLAWGTVSLDFHDWAEINVPRLTFLGRAIAAGELPLHMANTAPLHGMTDRFLALPDVITSPQTLLLRFVSVPAFVLIDVLIHFTAGMVGLIALRHRYRWSLFTFAVVFLLFMFNGHILSHYTVGHVTWAAYFLLPLVFLCLFRFLDGDNSWRLVAWFALLMFYIVLAGGQHHLTWVLLWIVFMVPFCWRRVTWLIAAASAAVLLSAVRLLPPALELRSFQNAGILTDVLGYPSVLHLISSMVQLRREQVSTSSAMPGNFWFFDHNYWEFNFYVGVVGLAIVAIFGVYRWLWSPAPRYPELIVPAFAMVALSLGSVYRLVRLSGIQIFEGERITSRMFSVPAVLLILMAGLQLNEWIRGGQLTRWQRLIACSLVGLLAIDISSSVRLLRLTESKRLFHASPIADAASSLAHRADRAYSTMLLVGLAITVVTAIALVTLSIRENRRRVRHG
jgi:hypothetical protein